MKRTDVRNKSIRGVAQIRMVGKKWELRVAVGEGRTELFEFAQSEVPSGAKVGSYQVSLSAKGDKWYSISPVKGQFKVRYLGMGGARPGQLPKPIYDRGGEKMGPNGPFDAEPSTSFLALVQVVEGPCKGMSPALFLPYTFVEGDGGFAELMGTKGQNDKLEAFMRAFGIDSVDLPYSDNILPDLDRALSAAAKKGVTADIMLKDGKFNGFAGEEDEVEEAEPVPARRNGAATKTKARR